MILADKIGAARIVAQRLFGSRDDLTDAIVSRYGADHAWLATDPDFLRYFAEHAQRGETGIWNDMGYDKEYWD